MAAARQKLSRDRIAEAGLELANEVGVDKVSTRGIAARLGVSSMAIYRHFDDMEELQSELLDRFTQRANVLPEDDLPWDEWLLHVSQRMFVAMTETPGWISLLGQIRLKPGALLVMDRGLDVLMRAGFAKRQAVQIFFVVNQAVIGAASLQNSLNNESRDRSIPIDRFEPDEFPVIYECLPELLTVLRSDMLEASMQWIIAGLRAELDGNQ